MLGARPIPLHSRSPHLPRLKGEKTSKDLRIAAKADWLLGLFGVRFTYPEPGKPTIKLLWKTLTDAEIKKGKAEEGGEGSSGRKEGYHLLYHDHGFVMIPGNSHHIGRVFGIIFLYQLPGVVYFNLCTGKFCMV